MSSGKELYKIGKSFLLKEDYNNAKIYYEKSAQLNYTKSFYFLGHIYENFIKTEDDINRSEVMMKYYTKGLELGDTKCKIALAILYYDGYLVHRDINKSIQLLEDSIKDGNMKGLDMLFLIYNYQLKNEDKALQYLNQSMLNNNPDSFAYYAEYLSYRKEPNWLQVRDLFFKSIECGSCEAFTLLMNILRRTTFTLSLDDIKKLVDLIINGNQRCKSYKRVRYINNICSLMSADYKFSKYILEILFNYKNMISFLEKQNHDLKTHIEYSPDGPGYLEAKKDFFRYV